MTVQILQPVRPLHRVPYWLWPIFFLALVLHACTTMLTSTILPVQTKLSLPQQTVLNAAAMGDPYFFASLGLIWLQYFDDQPGLALSYHDLNYQALVRWLDSFSQMAPKVQYPQFMASRLYANVSNEEKIRHVLAYLHKAFLEDPTRWRWLAEGAVIAQHRLKDLPLALKYAKDLTVHSPPEAPYWVKDMQILLLEALNEYDAALLLTGALLDSGELKDEYEINFLTEKLEALKLQVEANAGSEAEAP